MRWRRHLTETSGTGNWSTDSSTAFLFTLPAARADGRKSGNLFELDLQQAEGFQQGVGFGEETGMSSS